MQRESESEENVSWNEIGEVLDTEMSTVEDIRADLARNEKGNICQTINNCMLVFQRDPLMKGAIRKNELSGKIDIVGNLGWQRTSSSLTDTDVPSGRMSHRASPIPTTKFSMSMRFLRLTIEKNIQMYVK